MKKLLCLITITAFILSGCQSKAEKEKVAEETYEKAKESLEEREKKNPVEFISVTSKDKHNLIGQTVIKGAVHNKAKVCTYKDVELELSFFSKTGVLLEKDSEKVYEVIEPGKSAEFKTKYFAPKGTDSVALKVVGAKVN